MLSANSCWHSFGNWWAGEWQRGRRGPASRAFSRPPGPVAPLHLRSANPRGSAALLLTHVSGVRADVGTRHATATLREPGAAEVVGDVLGDGAGGRLVSVRPAVLFAFAQSKMLWTAGLSRRSRGGSGVQCDGRQVVERATPCSKDAR